MENETICMDIRSFAELVCRAVSEELGDGGQVKLQEVIKNNGVILQGLVILTRQNTISPTIYLNSFLEAYMQGVPLVRIVAQILEIYREDMPDRRVDMEFFRNFEKVKSRICYKLINRDKNRALLERIPHIDFLDLCICFFYAYEDDVLGRGSIMIYNSHMEMWNCSTEILFRAAKMNTRRLFPWKVQNMYEMLCAGLQRGKTSGPDEELPMNVLTNEQKVQGAVCMIYPGVLERLALEAGGNLYVIPSSIHEVLLMPEADVRDPNQLKSTIWEVNAAYVEPEEILSDNLYFYDRLKNHIDIV
jgi:hypothetical protein